jgi:hypothetical protein
MGFNTGQTTSVGQQALGGSFSKLGGVLGKIGSFAGPIGSLFDIGMGIAGLFRKSPEGLAKETASENQVDMEKRAAAVERAVNSGQMDPVSGLQEINNMISSLQAGGGASNQYDQRGVQRALMTMTQIKANLQQKVNWKLAETGDKAGGAGMAGISTDPGFQKEWVKNAMLNKLAGFERGNQQLKGSPLERLYQGPFDVQGGLTSAMNQSKQYNPDYKEPSRFEALRKRLAGGLDGSYFKG